MPRLLLVLLAALAGVAIWRRKEIRNDADRASKALAGAAETAKSRIRPGDAADEDQGEDGASTAAPDATTDTAGDLAESAASAD